LYLVFIFYRILFKIYQGATSASCKQWRTINIRLPFNRSYSGEV